VGATAFSGVYCPGLITAVVLYPPLFWCLSQITHREGLLSNTLGLVALLIAVVIHTVDVAMSVFALKLQSHRDTMNVLSLCHLSERSESHAQTANGEERWFVLGSEEVTMARLIQFHVPQNFKPPQRKGGVPLEQRGKIIQFPDAAIKKSA